MPNRGERLVLARFCEVNKPGVAAACKKILGVAAETSYISDKESMNSMGWYPKVMIDRAIERILAVEDGLMGIGADLGCFGFSRFRFYRQSNNFVRWESDGQIYFQREFPKLTFSLVCDERYSSRYWAEWFRRHSLRHLLPLAEGLELEAEETEEDLTFLFASVKYIQRMVEVNLSALALIAEGQKLPELGRLKDG